MRFHSSKMQQTKKFVLGFILFLYLSGLCFAEPLIQYHPSGEISVKGKLDADGLPHGSIQKFGEAGNLLSERTYRHGALHGLSKLYYPTGELMTEWNYKNGKRDGISLGYFRNGKLKDKGFYKQDKLDGTVQKYSSDGKLKVEMNFKNDRQEGDTKTFAEDGSLEFVYTYRKGRLLSRKEFDPQGKLIRDQDYPVLQVLP